MSELNFRVVHVYGLTETYGPITVCSEQEAWRELPLEQRAKYLARQGQAYLSADLVRVVDAEMNDVPQDGQAMGEVVMRGNNVMSGYYADEAATSKAFARRLVPFGGSGRVASRRQHRAARPRQRHHHLRRREHLQHRGRADYRRPPRCARMRGHRGPPPALGRAAQGIRHPQ